MKASFITVCAAAVVVLVSAFAETRTASIIRPDSLARVEAITSYCEKADPNATSAYLSKLAVLTRGRSNDDIERDRHSVKYQAALSQANETLSKTTQQTAVRACSEFLAEK